MLRRLSAARTTKNRSRAMPFVRFFFATFGAGVIATQCPITCPKRHIPPGTLYAMPTKWFNKLLTDMFYYGNILI
jgi:hypothetical protein